MYPGLYFYVDPVCQCSGYSPSAPFPTCVPGDKILVWLYAMKGMEDVWGGGQEDATPALPSACDSGGAGQEVGDDAAGAMAWPHRHSRRR
jgi:hypothetical protein